MTMLTRACSIYVAGGWLAQYTLAPVPPNDGFFYDWQLDKPSTMGAVTYWGGFALHTVLVWLTIWWAQNRTDRAYTKTLQPVNIVALGINALFIGLHYLQTLFFYDGIACAELGQPIDHDYDVVCYAGDGKSTARFVLWVQDQLQAGVLPLAARLSWLCLQLRCDLYVLVSSTCADPGTFAWGPACDAGDGAGQPDVYQHTPQSKLAFPARNSGSAARSIGRNGTGGGLVYMFLYGFLTIFIII